jgi:hypothetical protein
VICAIRSAQFAAAILALTPAWVSVADARRPLAMAFPDMGSRASRDKTNATMRTTLWMLPKAGSLRHCRPREPEGNRNML